MQKVVDSNFLQTDELRKYLSYSDRNHVVLTDYMAMEAYKGNTLDSIYPSFAVISQYPNQVVILKGTQVVCSLRGRRAGLQRRLIDNQQTREFRDFCRYLNAAERGDRYFEKQLLEFGREANTHMDRMLADATSFPAIFVEVAKNFTDAEIKLLQGNAQISKNVLDKILRNVMLLAAKLFRDHPRVTKAPTAAELPNTFIYRLSIYMYVLFIDWLRVGSPKTIKSEKMRNDLVDANFATYASFFDGLLTADRKLMRIYGKALPLIRMIQVVSRK